MNSKKKIDIGEFWNQAPILWLATAILQSRLYYCEDVFFVATIAEVEETFDKNHCTVYIVPLNFSAN